jgi:hypothetical protein
VKGTKTGTAPEVIQLRIELEGTKPLVWQRLQILANSSLKTLQYAINDVMEWHCSHLYVFEIGEDRYGDTELDLDFDDWIEDSKTPLLPRIAGESMGLRISRNPNPL